MAKERATSRDELLDFLGNPASYPHRPDRVELLETHISHVAIAGERVYKVKKPIHLQFLDYRSLKSRKKYCEAEVRLNRRLCDNVYLGVLPIGRNNGSLVFDAQPAVEYAVEMRRLPSEGFLHNRLEQEDFSEEQLDPVIQKVASFIASQEPSPETAQWGWVENIRISLDENLLETGGHSGKFVSQQAYDALAFFFKRYLEENYRLFAERRAGGCFINGHGDLRLEHIHLSAENVCIFDCIEFSERLRYIDFANELAFLAMEFDVEGRPDLRAYFLDEIEKQIERPLPRSLVTFYACYRAHVRAKVEGMQALDKQRDTATRQRHLRRAERRYRQAVQYAVGRGEPLAILVFGRPATGKSSVAKALGKDLGWPVFSSDLTRKRQAGVPLEKRPDPQERERLYSSERSRQVYDELKDEMLKACRQSNGAIVDATFSKKSDRDAFREVLSRAGCQHIFLELKASDQAMRRRLRQRADQQVVSDARLEDFEMLQQRYEEPSPLEDSRHLQIGAEGNISETVSEALRQLIQIQW